MSEQFTPSPRRGRPPAAKAEAPAAESAAPTARRRRASVGAASFKLQAPERKGFVRRWFNDLGNRIADAGELAYDFVTQPGIKSHSSDSRISRLVGTKPDGSPLHAFLMETPEDEYAGGLAEKEAHNRKVDEAIRDGRDSTGQMDSKETYGHGSIKTDR